MKPLANGNHNSPWQCITSAKFKVDILASCVQGQELMRQDILISSWPRNIFYRMALSTWKPSITAHEPHLSIPPLQPINLIEIPTSDQAQAHAASDPDVVHLSLSPIGSMRQGFATPIGARRPPRSCFHGSRLEQGTKHPGSRPVH